MIWIFVLFQLEALINTNTCIYFCVVGPPSKVQSKVRASQCERTCTSRIHKAAAGTFIYQSPPNKSPSLSNNIPSPLTLNRPRRLPALIKILTGFHENNSHIQPNNHHNVSQKGSIVIAYRSKPQFPTPTNTIQQVATSAAHAVWKHQNSHEINAGGMRTINKEWEEALRWIASWDEAVLQQHQPQGMDTSVFQGLNKIDELLHHLYSSVAGDKKQDYTSFVNDLTILLQTCIDKCLEDKAFDVWIEQEFIDDHDSDMTVAENLVTKSFFSWVFRESLFRILPPKTGAFVPSARYMFSGAVRLFAASLALYTVHCLWSGSSVLSRLYHPRVIVDVNSPEWLVEHEKELEVIKKSRQRKNSSKKSKRKGSNRKQSNRPQPATTKSNSIEQKSTNPAYSTCHNRELLNASRVSLNNQVLDNDMKDCWESNHLRQQTRFDKDDDEKKNEEDHDDAGADSFDGVPSSISISTISQTVSNYDHTEISDTAPLNEPTPSVTSRNHPRVHQPNIMNTQPRKPLLVPTEEQRNEAAQRLRDFQNAQIQRLMYQKKLKKSMQVSSVSGATSSITTTGLESPLSSSINSPKLKVLKPPPGFENPSNAFNLDAQEDEFFADNQLLLSKLLDDDDTVDDILSTDIGVDFFPQESSLDPSAAPFVLDGFNAKEMPSSEMDTQNCDSNWEKISANPGSKVKGVYGGTVW